MAIRLVDETGFDTLDAGPLADSWRQQPGAPPYVTDLAMDELRDAHGRAQQRRGPWRRDLLMAILAERTDAEGAMPVPERLTLARAIF